MENSRPLRGRPFSVHTHSKTVVHVRKKVGHLGHAAANHHTCRQGCAQEPGSDAAVSDRKARPGQPTPCSRASGPLCMRRPADPNTLRLGKARGFGLGESLGCR